MLNIETLFYGGGEPDTPTAGRPWAGRPVPSTAIVSPAGRLFFAHESGQGSVMCWNDNGVHKQTFISRASYVASGVRMASKTAICSGLPSWNTTFASGATKIPESWKSLTDSELYSAMSWHDPNSSAYNTDAHIAYYGSGYAAGTARSRTFSDSVLGTFACDLPNVQTIVRIWLDKDYLAQVYSDDNSYWSGWLNDGQAWASTMYSDGDVSNHNGVISKDGGCTGVWRDYSSSSRRVVPVHDIAELAFP